MTVIWEQEHEYRKLVTRLRTPRYRRVLNAIILLAVAVIGR